MIFYLNIVGIKKIHTFNEKTNIKYLNMYKFTRDITLSLALMLGFMWSLHGQDIHFTQYQHAPLTVNPAYTGNFYGTLRVNGVYRDQYRAIGGVFRTLNGSAEINLPFAFRKNDWIAAGIKYYDDSAGSIDQGMSMYAMNVAYHLSLDKNQNSIFTIGAQYGGGNIKYGTLGAQDLASYYENRSISPNLDQFKQAPGKTYVEGGELNDLVIGVLYTKYAKKSTFKMGLSVEGILRPSLGKSSAFADRKKLGFNISADHDFKFTPRTSLTSGAWIYVLGPSYAVNVNSKINYLIDPAKKITISGGLGTRTLNSIFLIAGMKFDNLQVGIAYDADISPLIEADQTFKGLELGATYIYKLYKKPQPKPVIFCPRL